MPLTSIITHTPSSTTTTTTAFPTLRLVTPSGFVNASDVSTSKYHLMFLQFQPKLLEFSLVQTSGQQVLLQQHGNLVITQPIVTVMIIS